MNAPTITHIEERSQNIDGMRRMLCGDTCIVLGVHIIPMGFDFYSFAHGHKATCTACQTERLRVTNTKELAEA